MQKKSSAYKLLHSLELDCIVNKQGPQKNMLNAGVEPAIVCSFVVFFFINTSFCREIIIRTKQMPYHLANPARESAHDKLDEHIEQEEAQRNIANILPKCSNLSFSFPFRV